MNSADESPTLDQLGAELTIAANRYLEAATRGDASPEAALAVAEKVQWVLGDLRTVLQHVSARLHEHRFDAKPGVLGPVNGIEAATAAAVRLEVAAGQARQASISISQARAQTAYLTWPGHAPAAAIVPSIRELMTGRAAALDSGTAPERGTPPRENGLTRS